MIPVLMQKLINTVAYRGRGSRVIQCSGALAIIDDKSTDNRDQNPCQ